MNKPNNYDQTPSGDFIPVELGGHIMVIKEVEETRSQKGKSMVIIRFDFAGNDSQPKYFSQAFEDDIRPDKKWPYQGTAYLLTEDDKGNCSRSFKRFTTAAEKSNKGFAIAWGDKFYRCLQGKYIGGVFGEVEEEYEGEVKTRRKLRWFCEAGKAKDAVVPEKKTLPQGSAPQPAQQAPVPVPPAQMQMPELIPDDDIPF